MKSASKGPAVYFQPKRLFRVAFPWLCFVLITLFVLFLLCLKLYSFYSKSGKIFAHTCFNIVCRSSKGL